jgi:uncharacterized protein with HEPN domain
VQDMQDNIAFIQKALQGLSKQDFEKDDILQRAIERYYEIIGEAARNIPIHIQKKYPDIDWANIIGMRNKIAHDYVDVSLDVLWLTAKSKLDPLKKNLKILLDKEDT